MFVDDERRLIFFHVPKTAGTSISKALWPDRPHAGHCLPSQAVLAPDQWRYFKFSVVRNPFDRLVSAWAYGVQGKYLPLPKYESFHDFVWGFLDESVLATKDSSTQAGLRPQSWFLNPKGDPPRNLNYIGRFEELEKLRHALRSILGDCPPFPKLNRTNRRHYRSYFQDSALKAHVEGFYRQDLEEYGYEF